MVEMDVFFSKIYSIQSESFQKILCGYLRVLWYFGRVACFAAWFQIID